MMNNKVRGTAWLPRTLGRSGGKKASKKTLVPKEKDGIIRR
jgi:hypothetical protein